MWDGVNKNIQIAYMEGMCGFDGVDPLLCVESFCDVQLLCVFFMGKLKCLILATTSEVLCNSCRNTNAKTAPE